MCSEKHTGDTYMQKRVQVSFTERQWDLITYFKGEFGETDAEVIRSIVLAWLAEKSFISTSIKNRMKGENQNEK